MNKNMTRRDFLKLLGLTVGTATTTGVISEINKLRKENEAYDEQAETTNEQTEVETIYEDTTQIDEIEEVEEIYDIPKYQREVNEDIIGVIEADWIEGSSLPIIQITPEEGHDHNHYLSYSPNGTASPDGSIFFWYDSDMKNQVSMIYGHNTHKPENLMFTSLPNFSNQDFYEQNPSFKIYILNNDEEIYEYTMDVFAYVEENADTVLLGNYETREDFIAAMEKIKERSAIDTNVEIGTGNMVVLNACTVRGSRIDINKRALLYAVSHHTKTLKPAISKMK